MAPSSTNRNWMFTINNPRSTVSSDNPKNWKFAYRFLAWQLEKAPETGTLHYQGYICFKNPVRLNALKKYCARAHWDARKGTHDQALAYVTKVDTQVEGPWTLGKAPSQGKRSDIDALKSSIDSGATMIEIAEQHFGSYLKYSTGIQKYKTMKTPPRTWKTEVTVCYGMTGCGKSHFCHTMAPDAYCMTVQDHVKWWDGYDAHSDVIIDEFGGQLPFKTALQLLDKYPVNVEVKGATVPFVPRRLFLTSNDDPSDWYHVELRHREALLRRLDYIYRYDVPYNPDKDVVPPVALKLPPPPPLPPMDCSVLEALLDAAGIPTFESLQDNADITPDNTNGSPHTPSTEDYPPFSLSDSDDELFFAQLPSHKRRRLE